MVRRLCASGHPQSPRRCAWVLVTDRSSLVGAARACLHGHCSTAPCAHAQEAGREASEVYVDNVRAWSMCLFQADTPNPQVKTVQHLPFP